MTFTPLEGLRKDTGLEYLCAFLYGLSQVSVHQLMFFEQLQCAGLTAVGDTNLRGMVPTLQKFTMSLGI